MNQHPSTSQLEHKVVVLTGALRLIAYMRPAGDINTAKNVRRLIERMERIAIDALDETNGEP